MPLSPRRCVTNFKDIYSGGYVVGVVRSEELRQDFRHLTLISKKWSAAGHVIKSLRLRAHSTPRIAWEQNTNRH
jgi:hypothetical protein